METLYYIIPPPYGSNFKTVQTNVNIIEGGVGKL